jgi:hypothetical protein
MARRPKRPRGGPWLALSLLAALALIATAQPSTAGTSGPSAPADAKLQTIAPANAFTGASPRSVALPAGAGATAPTGAGDAFGGWRRTADTNGPKPPHEEGDPPPVPGGGCNSGIAVQTSLRTHPDYGPESITGITAAIGCSAPIQRVWHRTGVIDRTPGFDGNTFRADPEPVFACDSCTGGQRSSGLILRGDLWDNGRQIEVFMDIELELGWWGVWESCNTPPGLRFLSPCQGIGTSLLRVRVGTGPRSTLLSPPVARYVALGDSYSAGSGTGSTSYVPDGTTCNRSVSTYSAQLVARGATIGGFPIDTPLNRACHDARILDFSVTQHARGAEKPQLDWLNEHRTRLVTLSIGGNDLGFPEIARRCAGLDDLDADCSDGPPLLDPVRLAEVRHSLPLLLEHVRDRMRSDGYLLVLDYPVVIPDPNDTRDHNTFTCPEALLDSELAAIHAAARTISTVVMDAVRQVGDPRIVPVSVRDLFAGHRICADEPWGNEVSLNTNEAYHPNARGYQEVADRLRSQLAFLSIQPRGNFG